MKAAAREAIAYRRGVAAAETTPVTTYREMVAAFDAPLQEAPLQEAPGKPSEIIADLITRATPGVRAATSSGEADG